MKGASVLRSAHGNDSGHTSLLDLGTDCRFGLLRFWLLRSARAQERRRLEEGQQHTKRDTALLLLAALFMVGLLLGAIFLVPSNTPINSRAGFYAIAVVFGGGLTYL